MTLPSGQTPARAQDVIAECERLLKDITPGEWTVADSCIAVGDTHVVCFGHDYDDYGGIQARTELLGKYDQRFGFSAAGSAAYEAEKAANAAFLASSPRLVRDLLAHVSALRAALATFGKHKNGCASGWRAATGSSQIGPCDCGFDAAFTTARALLADGNEEKEPESATKRDAVDPVSRGTTDRPRATKSLSDLSLAQLTATAGDETA